jgi:predicted nucleic acid-binding protein
VFSDAEQVLGSIVRHEGATSALTYYEVEEALYKTIAASTRGVANAEADRVSAARSIVPQTAIAIQFFNIEVLDLTSETVDAQLRTLELQTHGIRAADALHLASAVR